MIIQFLLILLFIVILFIAAKAYGLEKNVTITLEKGEFWYCHYGSSKSPTPICDYFEMDNSFTMIDRFLEYMNSGILKD